MKDLGVKVPYYAHLVFIVHGLWKCDCLIIAVLASGAFV